MKYRILFAILLMGSATAVMPECRADILYTFDGHITPYSGAPFGAHETFTYLAKSFITADTIVPASALSSSSVVGNYPGHTQEIEFLVSSPGWGGPAPKPVQIAFIDGVANPNYYFPIGAFGESGTYNTVSYPGANTGTLTVSQQGAITPEPSSLVLLITALPGLGGYRWWRRHRPSRDN
jgi:hypothetical protein